ncbi:MAG: ABC transporter permease [Eubacteriales bacterium]|nr:ABC transporter permease [Eubacteriales bacterium]
MLAVYKKEIKSYFMNMTGYVFVSFILLIAGIFCTAMNLKSGYPNFEYALSSMGFTFIFVIPILTMRALAEEKHQKTDQLLFSLPISVPDIILGKYFAMLTVLAIPIGIICLYPLILMLYGTVHITATYSAIFGFFLLGAALIAIGMFMSALTESQIIAAVLSFGAILLAYLMGGLSAMVPATALASFIAFTVCILAGAYLIHYMTKNSTVAYIAAIAGESILFVLYFVRPALFTGAFNKVLGWLSLYDRFNSFIYGIFDITAIVYYLSVIFIFVFFSIQSVEKQRWS